MINFAIWVSFLQEEKLPYAFYISNQELLVPLGNYLEKNKGQFAS